MNCEICHRSILFDYQFIKCCICERKVCHSCSKASPVADFCKSCQYVQREKFDKLKDKVNKLEELVNQLLNHSKEKQ